MISKFGYLISFIILDPVSSLLIKLLLAKAKSDCGIFILAISLSKFKKIYFVIRFLYFSGPLTKINRSSGW